MKKISKKSLLAAAIIVLLLVAGIFVCVFLTQRYGHISGAGKNIQNRNSAANNAAITQNSFTDIKNNENSASDNSVPAPTPPPTEKYEAKLFVEASWGKSRGQVGLSNPSDQGIVDAGPNYGPQSFDVANDGHLFLLDSVNERMIEYDQNGKYVKDFPIGCGGTGDIRVSPDQEFLYVFSWRCGAVYEYDLAGKPLETYKLSKDMLMATLGGNGLGFDESGNIMLGMAIDGYGKENKEERFFQIGKNGDEWKNNNYKGFLLSNGDYYYDRFIDWQTGGAQIIDKNGSIKKEFTIKDPEQNSKMYMYFAGSDSKNNVYERIDVEFNNPADDKGTDNMFLKYDLNGNKIATIDVLTPLSYKERGSYFYTDYFQSRRVSKSGEIYYAFFFKDKGEKIYKYSKVD
jgi:hypothetical protein